MKAGTTVKGPTCKVGMKVKHPEDKNAFFGTFEIVVVDPSEDDLALKQLTGPEPSYRKWEDGNYYFTLSGPSYWELIEDFES